MKITFTPPTSQDIADAIKQFPIGSLNEQDHYLDALKYLTDTILYDVNKYLWVNTEVNLDAMSGIPAITQSTSMSKQHQGIDIVDVETWITPLDRYVAFEWEYTVGAYFDLVGISINDVSSVASYRKTPDPWGFSGDFSNAPVFLVPESKAMDLIRRAQANGLHVRFVKEQWVPRFHETEWQKTNGIEILKNK